MAVQCEQHLSASYMHMTGICCMLCCSKSETVPHVLRPEAESGSADLSIGIFDQPVQVKCATVVDERGMLCCPDRVTHRCAIDGTW